MKTAMELRRAGKDMFSPTRELTLLQRGIDRLFDDFLAPLYGGKAEKWDVWSPPADVEEDEAHYVVSFDLPGISKDNIKIEVNGNQLTVRGERKVEHEEKKKSRYLSECYYGTFERTFTLPANVSPEKVEAHYEDGVLKIGIPKTEVSKARLVKVA